MTPPKRELDHTGRSMKETWGYYGDTMRGYLFDEGSVTKCFTVRVPTRAASAKFVR
jgi:hypothetical protein